MDSKIHKVMGEFKRGTLRSGGMRKVKNKRQAIAIALSEAREAGEHVKQKPKSLRRASKLTRALAGGY